MVDESAYLGLIREVAAYVPPLDQAGFHETLARLDKRLTEISVRPRKHELRLALHALCRVNANTRFAELNLSTRF